MKLREITTTELCDILDELQGQLENATQQHAIDALKGSYGVYLHYLRHHDSPQAAYYLEWMREYNKKQSVLI